jgi:hypothetical protein
LPFVVLVLGLIGGGMLALLALNTASAANEVSRHDIADADQSIAAQVEQLQIDARNSAAPGNLARAAQALGMVPAGNPGFIEIGRNGAVRVLGRAAPATAPPVYMPPTHKPTKDRHHAKKSDRTHHGNGDIRKPTKKKRDETQKTQRDKPGREHGRHGERGGRHGTTGGHSHQPPAQDATTTTPSPTPTPTPTPTITLPGGNR